MTKIANLSVKLIFIDNNTFITGLNIIELLRGVIENNKGYVRTGFYFFVL